MPGFILEARHFHFRTRPIRSALCCGHPTGMLRVMIQPVHEIAAEVIRKTGKDKPADAALREVLKSLRDLAPFDATEVAKTVFIYYRWHVWLREERGVESKMRLALRLNQRFQESETSVPLAELRAKAVPAWTAECLEVTDDWLRSLQHEPKLWLRAKRGQAAALADKLFGAEVNALLPDALLYRGEEDLFKTPEFHAGEFEIQDIASQMVGLLCAPQPGQTWWDTCAGEGGKTLHLSDLMQNKGLLWASDRAEWRLQKLKRRTGRGQGVQLPLRVLGWRPETPHENQVRRRARGRAVQRHRHLAAQSAGALDDERERRARTLGHPEEPPDQRRPQREARWQADLFRLHPDAGGDRGGDGTFQRQPAGV